MFFSQMYIIPRAILLCNMSDKPHLLPGERQSVDKAHKTVYHTEDEHLLVHQFVDAALPVEQQAREAAEPGVGHATRVSYCHRVNSSHSHHK